MDAIDFLRTYTYEDIFNLYKDNEDFHDSDFINHLIEHKDVEISSQEYEAWEKLYNATIEYMEGYKEELLKQAEVFIKQLYNVANTPISHRVHRYKVVEDD